MKLTGQDIETCNREYIEVLRHNEREGCKFEPFGLLLSIGEVEVWPNGDVVTYHNELVHVCQLPEVSA